MTTRENLLAAAKAASEDYASARRSLEIHRSLHALGMSSDITTASDEAGWIKQPLLRFPGLAGHRHVGPILLGRVNAFF